MDNKMTHTCLQTKIKYRSNSNHCGSCSHNVYLSKFKGTMVWVISSRFNYNSSMFVIKTKLRPLGLTMPSKVSRYDYTCNRKKCNSNAPNQLTRNYAMLLLHLTLYAIMPFWGPDLVYLSFLSNLC